MESRSKVNVTKDQVDQVADIMKGNMNKIMEREGKLQDLELKADKLQVDSQQFQVYRYFWQQCCLCPCCFSRKQ